MLEDVTVDYGKALHLTCPVYGGDDLVVTEWYKDAEPIDIKMGTQFNIISQHKDAGMYHCIALQKGQQITSNVARVTVRGILTLINHTVVICLSFYCSCC